tara:strand:- start:291 stop:578 length:288 start_codon:yes stop_codon:yes gene_type:complete
LVKSDIIKELKKKHPKLKLSQIESILDLIFDTISKRLINNRSIEIRDFCRFSIRTTKAKHNARNPRTGSTIYVPSKKKVFFKMSKHLKEEINKES